MRRFVVAKWLVKCGWRMTPEQSAHVSSGSQVGGETGRVFRTHWFAARFANRMLKTPGWDYAHIERVSNG